MCGVGEDKGTSERKSGWGGEEEEVSEREWVGECWIIFCCKVSCSYFFLFVCRIIAVCLCKINVKTSGSSASTVARKATGAM